MLSRSAAWAGYAAAWAAATLFWTFASASGAGVSPLESLPYALLAMGSAAAMGVGIWWLTGRLPWSFRSPRCLAIHAAAWALFCVVYATSWIWIDILQGRFTRVAAELPRSPVLLWNLLMGTWLYLMLAGLFYAIRAHERLRAQEADAAEARLLAQQAQLAALRAQINPHFLFNALHSVGALVSSDPARADRALERLGDLLRYALQSSDQVPLRSELEFTRNYVALEQLRLGDRLRVSERIDDEAESVLVPPLILQPLVENVVRHGIADAPDGGTVEVSAHVTRDRCRLGVVDDGRGAVAGAEPGIGLASIRRRLEVLYGDRATIEVNQRATGFAVTIDLPVRAGGTLT
jgi:hypothetical protein